MQRFWQMIAFIGYDTHRSMEENFIRGMLCGGIVALLIILFDSL